MQRYLILVLGASFSIHAATLTVTPDGSSGYSNIQDAINDAPIGGWTEIVVHPGVYYENLHVDTNQHIYLHSTNECSDAVRAATVIDGSGTGCVLFVDGALAVDGRTTCTVAGVTLRNGYAEAGGGIRGANHYSIELCYINVRCCVIADCYADGNANYLGGGGLAHTRGDVVSNVFSRNMTARSGGGIYNCAGSIAHNVFESNHANQNGGAVIAMDGPVVGNVFSNNSALSGGAVHSCSELFAHNTVTRNYAGSSGGGIYGLRSTLAHHNVFSHNVAAVNGGAIYYTVPSSKIDFINNLLHGNVASNRGGAIFMMGHDLFLNNTIADNWSSQGGAGIDTAANATFINTIIAGNRDATGAVADLHLNVDCEYYYCCVPGGTGLDGTSTSNDPEFVSPETGNYHLRAASPCVNTGGDDFHYPLAYAADLDGLMRYDGVIDMGCYERGSQPDHDGDWLIDTTEPGLGADPTKWDTNNDGYPDGLHVARGQGVNEPLSNRTFMVAPGASVQAPYGRAVAGDTIILATGVFSEIILPLRSIALRGTTDVNGDPATVIDGQGRRAGLLMNRTGSFDSNGLHTVVADLVISNGMAPAGGGIRLVRADADTLIDNCVLTGNRAHDGGGIGGPDDATVYALRNSRIVGNHADNWGGGVCRVSDHYLGQGISGCEIAHNSASNGGGVADCYATVQRCLIVSNTAMAEGGGVYRPKDSLRNNLIAFNTAARGAAIADPFSGGEVLNNTIVRNAATVAGGGVDAGSSARTLCNNIVWSNTAPLDPQIVWAANSNDVCHNTIQNWTDSSQGNQSSQPLFVSFAGADFHLLSNDAANIETGTNRPVEIMAQLDLDGRHRVIGFFVDRGCYETGEEGFDVAVVTQRFAVVLECDASTPVQHTAGTHGTPRLTDSPQMPMRYMRYLLALAGTHLVHGFIMHTVPQSFIAIAGQDQRAPHQMSYLLPVKRLFTDAGGFTYLKYDQTLQVDRDDAPHAVPVFTEPYIYPPTPDASLHGFQFGRGDSMWEELSSVLRYEAAQPTADIAPRDGHPGHVWRAEQSPMSNEPTAVAAQPCGISTALPQMDDAAAVGTPGDTAIVYGRGVQSSHGSMVYGPNTDPCYGTPLTASIAPLDSDYGSFTPAYVDLNGDGALDSDKLWVANQGVEVTELALHDVVQGTDAMTLTIPAQGQDYWQVGSYPYGVAAAGLGDNVLYVYDYSNPVLPSDGTWLSTVFECAIIRIGYGTSPEIIPEPVAAVVLYVLAGVATLVLVRRR